MSPDSLQLLESRNFRRIQTSFRNPIEPATCRPFKPGNIPAYQALHSFPATLNESTSSPLFEMVNLVRSPKGISHGTVILAVGTPRLTNENHFPFGHLGCNRARLSALPIAHDHPCHDATQSVSTC